MNNPQKNQKGAVVIIVAVVLLTLIAFVGLAVDSGYMFVKKNELQNVADAVALACLIKDRDTACGTAPSPIVAGTPNANVKSNDDIKRVLTPVIPPGNIADYNVSATYPYTGATYPFTPCPSSANLCAEASASTKFTPFFMRAFGFSNLPISASAVAAKKGQPLCMVVTDTLHINGTPDIQGINCDIFMGKAQDTGTARQIATHNYIYNGHASSDCSACLPPAIPVAGPVPLPPLLPNPPVWSTANPQTDPKCKNATCTLTPGYYQHGIDCSGSQGNCIFNSGLYYLDDQLLLAANNGTSKSNGGVFFYMHGTGTKGLVDMSAGGVIQLTNFGGTTGSCAATNNQLLIYSPNAYDSNQQFLLKGNTGSSLVGNIYLTGYDMVWKGGHDMTLNGTVVLSNFSQNGNNDLIIHPTLSCPSSDFNIVLIE